MNKKILIIEDDKDVIKLLEYNLTREGYKPLAASDGEAGYHSFKKNNPDLILLDLMLPKRNGFELCRLIRQESSVPIIMLTAKHEEVDRVLGLELGADDYVIKPFSVRELLARIKALLRRTVSASRESGKKWSKGELEISFDAFEARIKGRAIALTTKEFELLRILVQAKGKVFPREDLLEAVWGSPRGSELDTRTVDQHVARLRRKLGSSKKYLITVKNRGYRFQDKVK